MLKRKIEEVLMQWKKDKNHKPLIIKGCRQCGKTYSALDFAHKNYKNVVYINFQQNKEYASAFSSSLDVDYIVMMLSAFLGPDVNFEPGNTVIIFDEIQECPEVRTSLKFFHIDGRYDVIGTGSLLGIKGYREKPSSVPVGYETQVTMKPLDFEEFLWANGIKDDIINILKKCLNEITPVPEPIHVRMNQLYMQYAVVGGMPDAVNEFIQSKLLNKVLQIQRNIINSYEDDMLKYADKKDKTCIIDCFRSIPRQLAKENKKFQYSVIKKGATSSKFEGSLRWIEDAGIIVRCRNLNNLELPLSGSSMDDVFKVYMQDCGLFVAMLEEGTQADILQGNIYTYNGAINENLTADIFTKMNRDLYYFHKESGLEVDFVTRYKGECTLVEVKSTTGNTKSTKTILAHPEKYYVNNAIKLGDYNVGHTDRITTLPKYMAFLLIEY